MNRALSPVKAAVASNAPKRFGYLSKSIRIKLKILESGKAYAVVGPSRSFVRTKGKYTRGPRIGQARRFIPAFIAHLVELGHGGKHAARAHPFLQTAMDQTFDTYCDTVNEQIRQEISKALTK